MTRSPPTESSGGSEPDHVREFGDRYPELAVQLRYDSHTHRLHVRQSEVAA
jgi:hypothetical protein